MFIPLLFLSILIHCPLKDFGILSSLCKLEADLLFYITEFPGQKFY
jgi:hypothetical protein